MIPHNLIKRFPGSHLHKALRSPSSITSFSARSSLLGRSVHTASIPPRVPPSTSLSSFQRRKYAQPATMVNATNGAQDYGNFKLLQSFDLKYAPVNVSKWRSEKTGLTVTLGNHAAPITNGYFVIASEIFDDTGRPHTLEHLVFLGSKSYPYKGVLDQLANRAGSDGTNAWTANDHTAYTMETAGSKGFLNMLPIYVDHILHPIMSDAGFVTEVHHINGEGEDAGVVYSEMQGRENQSWDRMSLKLQRSLYPETSAYRSETGGLLKMLRVLTAEQIRQYHGQYYVPHNLCLVMDGAVNPEELFDVLNNKVEPMILAQQKKDPAAAGTFTPPAGWKRPFVETATAQNREISQSETHVVEFMEEDESSGVFMTVWLGPAPNDHLSDLALDVLSSYLSESATSPLQKEFVEIPEPLATSVGFMTEARVKKSEITIVGTGVPKKRLEEMPNLVKAKLAKIANEEGIDMDRMALVLRRERRNTLNQVESRVTDAISHTVIQDFLYCEKDGKELPEAFDDLEDYSALEKWTAQDWIAFINKWFVNANSITTIGRPSAQLAAELEKDEKARVAEQKAKFGEEGLKKLQEELDAAKQESDKPIPEEMLTTFPAINPADLTWIPVETALNKAPGDTVNSDQGAVQQYIEADGQALPYQTHFAHVKSNFVLVNALLDTAKIPSELLPYLSLFRWALFNSGVRRADGTELSHEEVVNQLDDLTVYTNTTFGMRGVFPESLAVTINVEKERYAEAVAWLRDILEGTQFTKGRLEVLIAKEVQNLPDRKRSGGSVARSVLSNLAYDSKRSAAQNGGLLNHLEVLPRIAEEIQNEPEKVIATLEKIRTSLVDPSVLRVAVWGDILSLPSPRSTLAKSFLPIKEAVPRLPEAASSEFFTELGKNPAKKIELVSMGAIEGSYSAHQALGPEGWDHPDVPAMYVTAKVLNTMESYLWKAIRGSGLAYGAYLDFDLESGTIGFTVSRSPNAFLAYREAAKVLKGLADGTTEIDQNIVDGACASEAYTFARAASTGSKAASTSYVDEILKGVGKQHSQELLAKLSSVTIPQIRECIAKYFVKLFDPATSIAAVAVNSGKADEVEAGFKEFGFEVSRRELPTLGEDSDSEMGSESASESEDEPMEDVRSP